MLLILRLIFFGGILLIHSLAEIGTGSIRKFIGPAAKLHRNCKMYLETDFAKQNFFEFYSIPNSCSEYIMCRFEFYFPGNNYNDMYIEKFSCKDNNTVFDEASHKCQLPEQAKNSKCSKDQQMFYTAAIMQEGLPAKTFNDTSLADFCKKKEFKDLKGYTHPNFCSKLIECWHSKSNSGFEEIKFKEKTCPTCEISIDCPYGYSHWDEQNQKCIEPNQSSCRQEELPPMRIIGRKDLSKYCDRKRSSVVPHPDKCEKFIYCQIDKPTKSIYVEEKTCAKCTQNVDGASLHCPDGYYHYLSDGICALASFMEPNERCNKNNIIALRGTPIVYEEYENSTTYASGITFSENLPTLEFEYPTIIESPSTLIKTESQKPIKLTTFTNDFEKVVEGKQTETAEFVCATKPQIPRGYPHPTIYHKFIFCYFNFSNYYNNKEEESMMENNMLKNLEFECPKCEINIETCPNGRLQFDLKSQECRTEAQAIIDTTTLQTKEVYYPLKNVKKYCEAQLGNISADIPHPIDKSCTKYISCWFEQNHFKERTCDLCKTRPGRCPDGFLYFDPITGFCHFASQASCIPEHRPTKPTTLSKSERTDGRKRNVDVVMHELMTAQECDPRVHIQRGYCKTFFYCDQYKRFEEPLTCSTELFWNPDRNSIHGGICDFLTNIDNYTVNRYKSDSYCPLDAAYFRSADKECQAYYFYSHPTGTKGQEVKLFCPENLLFSMARKTCAECQDTERRNGRGNCCSMVDSSEEEEEVNTKEPDPNIISFPNFIDPVHPVSVSFKTSQSVRE